MSNYPLGAADDPAAPYNEVERDYISFDALVSTTLSANKKVLSGAYTFEDGEDTPLIEESELARAYDEDYYTPAELLDKLTEMAETELAKLQAMLETAQLESMQYSIKSKMNDWMKIKRSAESWSEDELTVMEN